MTEESLSDKTLTIDDYPLVEKRPELVQSATGQNLDALTLEAVLAGDVTMEDLRITATALRQQAEIARAAHRTALAENFARGAEMTALPQPVIMEVYELLRPGRAKDEGQLLAAAARLRRDHDADCLAAFLEEAADLYRKRGLFKSRF